MIRNIIGVVGSYIKANDFLKKAVTLMSGTILSQIIMFVGMLALSRIYAPKDFGIYTLFTSCSSIFIILAAAKYELAILLPKEDKEAFTVFIATIFIISSISILLLILQLFFAKQILTYFHYQSLYDYNFYIPLYVFLSATYQSLYYWFNRKELYDSLSKSRVIISVTNTISSVLIGLSLTQGNGLITGLLIAQLIGVLYLSFMMIKKKMYYSVQIMDLKNVIKRYIDFPKFSLLGSVCNNVALQLPAFLFGGLYGESVLGYYSLGLRAINAPLQLITQSFGDVFRQRAAKDFCEIGNCSAFFSIIMKKLFIIGMMVFVPLFFIAPQLFSLVFGAEWYMAGVYTQILCPMYIIRCVASPLSSIETIAEKQKFGLIFQISILIITASFVFLGNIISDKAEVAVGFFGLGYTIIYFMSILLNKKWAGGKNG